MSLWLADAQSVSKLSIIATNTVIKAFKADDALYLVDNDHHPIPTGDRILWIYFLHSCISLRSNERREELQDSVDVHRRFIVIYCARDESGLQGDLVQVFGERFVGPKEHDMISGKELITTTLIVKSWPKQCLYHSTARPLDQV